MQYLEVSITQTVVSTKIAKIVSVEPACFGCINRSKNKISPYILLLRFNIANTRFQSCKHATFCSWWCFRCLDNLFDDVERYTEPILSITKEPSLPLEENVYSGCHQSCIEDSEELCPMHMYYYFETFAS